MSAWHDWVLGTPFGISAGDSRRRIARVMAPFFSNAGNGNGYSRALREADS